ncbi:hypothetical protein BCE_2930 [Bacillus cereus ATCC 10987]|uniref:Uncharacterized protein n=1 Tax=Bacillus cereus (strain ATCC 10987 / NRS 248) TaxID=222523 RepID=Q736H1_BACC1|nr:hypothetical protein BCE_2930 [Bacillus cereus ATCC 10987]
MLLTYRIHIIIKVLFMYFQILFSAHFLSYCPTSYLFSVSILNKKGYGN